MGVDSLMGVELAGRLAAGLSLEQRLPSTLIFDHPTILAIAQYIEQTVLGFASSNGVHPPPDEATRRADKLNEQLTDLSDDEVELLLLAKLKEIR